MPSRTLLLQSYPAEIAKVMKDLKDMELLKYNSKEQIEDSLVNLMERYTFPLVFEDDFAIICDVGRVDKNVYLSAKGNHLRLDAFDMSLTLEKENPAQDSAFFTEELRNYFVKNYPENYVQCFESDHKNTIIMTKIINDTNNQFTASISFRFECHQNSFNSICEFKSRNFEECNISASNFSNFSCEISEKMTILSAIEKSIKNFRLNLNNFYSEIYEQNFKHFRRALPITKAKIDWQNFTPFLMQKE